MPYARILDRMVTIKDGVGARQVTAEEAFLLYLRKKALDGNEAAQERLEEIHGLSARVRSRPGSRRCFTTIVSVIVSPDNPNRALLQLKMAVKLYRLPTSRPNQARAMACPASARSARRPAPKRQGAGDRRRRDADAYEGPMAGLVEQIVRTPIPRTAEQQKLLRKRTAGVDEFR